MGREDRECGHVRRQDKAVPCELVIFSKARKLGGWIRFLRFQRPTFSQQVDPPDFKSTSPWAPEDRIDAVPDSSLMPPELARAVEK